MGFVFCSMVLVGLAIFIITLWNLCMLIIDKPKRL
jgi:uncharacterized membrane protein YiaA